jgi:predicted glycosyltransferase
VDGENNLSGDLSHKKPLLDKFKFIGVLSRFAERKIIDTNTEFDFMAVLSGPEPQRTIFENIILKQVKNSNLKGILVRGLPEDYSECKIQNAELKVFNHLETDEFLHYLQKSKVVISRSGYSTIMDLSILGKKAILVPTPGQTEQE